MSSVVYGMVAKRSSEAALVLGVSLGLGLPASSDAVAQSIPLASAMSQLATPPNSTAGGVRPNVRYLTFDPDALKAAKAAAKKQYLASTSAHGAPSASGPAVSEGPSPAFPASPVAPAAVVGGLNKPGIDGATSLTSPPDTTGAIGPSNYLEITNSLGIDNYDRSLVHHSAARLDSFTKRQGSCHPQVLWDALANRWFYAAVDCSGNPANYALLFGWTKTADPTDVSFGWCTFALNTSSTGTNTGFSDFPKLGHNRTNMIIGTNDYVSNRFTTARLWIFPKPANGDASCTPPKITHTTAAMKNPDGTKMFTPVPANEVDNPVNGYITAAHIAPSSKIALLHIAGTAAAPTLVTDGDITVPAYAAPGDVPQPGTTNVIDTFDGRLTQAIGRKDSAIAAEAIWTQHTINGAGGMSIVRWYEIDTASKTVHQSAYIYATGGFVFNGAISPTNAGGSAAVITLNLGSSSDLVSLYALSRVTSSALNSMPRPVVLLGTSYQADKDHSCSPCAWGLYAGATPDPKSNNVVWGSGQLNGSSTEYTQWVTRNYALSP